jgi:two-component system, NtrC family, nitrogen regulation sensor histidine kinase NtrY
MRYVVLAGLGLGAILLYLLFSSSRVSPLVPVGFPLVLVGGAASASLLFGLVSWQLIVLRRRVRNGVFGSKLTLKLLLWFSLVAILPAAVVFSASVFFLNRSIETWFDVRVDRALESGVNLGQTALDDLLRELTKKSERLALTLSDERSGSMITLLSNLREQSAVQELTLFDDRGGVIAYAGGEKSTLLPELPDKNLIWRVRQQEPYSRVEALKDGSLVMRTLVPVYANSFAGKTLVLQVLQSVPNSLERDAGVVQDAYRDYQQIAVSRLGLKRLYGVTLALTLLIALLMTISLAYFLSERLGAPLRTLARGTRAVAQGDFSQMHPVQSRDELGALIRSFNRMTQQLSEARAEAGRNHLETEQAKAYLETVLANLSSGVVVLDEVFRVQALNPTALRILGAQPEDLERRFPVDWGVEDSALRVFGHQVAGGFEAQSGALWQQQLDYNGPEGAQLLLVRGTPLPQGVARGYTLVFDDVTKLIRAERDAAWGEVARRLAHEIRNPLTPIQLSAERIAQKLGSRLEGAERDFLIRSTRTIINQVGAMKSMVEAFANYARMPRAHIVALDLNGLVREVLSLYDFHALGLSVELPEDLPPVAGDSTLLRQVIHNLLQNAQDALGDRPDGRIAVKTQLQQDRAVLTICDNGPGFPEHLMAKLFEPYATTKLKGTGLGLPIVKKIVEEHQGNIRVENQAEGGARIRVFLPLFRLGAGL